MTRPPRQRRFSTASRRETSLSNQSETLHPIRSLFFTLGIQIVARTLLGSLDNHTLVTVTHFAFALSLSRLLSLSRPWQLCNILIPVGLNLQTGSLLPFIGFLISLMIFWPTLREPIPFYPSRRAVFQHLATILSAERPRDFADLGSGTGSVLFALARRFPEISFVGYEIGYLPLLLSRIRSLWYPHVTIINRSIWDIHLGTHSCVYAFLSPTPMARLEEKLAEELPKGCIFLSNSFPLPLTEARTFIEIGGQSLFVYRSDDIGVKSQKSSWYGLSSASRM
jgi:hypothetical protein